MIGKRLIFSDVKLCRDPWEDVGLWDDECQEHNGRHHHCWVGISDGRHDVPSIRPKLLQLAAANFNERRLHDEIWKKKVSTILCLNMDCNWLHISIGFLLDHPSDECGGWWCNYSPTCSSSSSVLLFRSSSCLFFLFWVALNPASFPSDCRWANRILISWTLLVPGNVQRFWVAAYCFYTIELCRFRLVVIDFSVPPLSSRLCCLWPFPRRQEKNKRTRPFFPPLMCCSGGSGWGWVGRRLSSSDQRQAHRHVVYVL